MLFRVDVVKGEVQGEESLCEPGGPSLESSSLSVYGVERRTLLDSSAYKTFSTIGAAVVTLTVPILSSTLSTTRRIKR